MTASEKPDKILQSAPSLLSDTVLLVYSMRAELYGYAAWLLIPCLVLLLPAFVDPQWTDLINGLGNGLYFALSIWVMAAITLAITLHFKQKIGANISPDTAGILAWQLAPKLFWVIILTAILEIFGYVLLIVPGIIATVWFALAPFEIILQSKDVVESLKESKKLSEGRFFAVLVRLIIGALVFGLGSLIIALPVLLYSGADANLPVWFAAAMSALDIIFFPFIVSYELLLYFALKSK